MVARARGQNGCAEAKVRRRSIGGAGARRDWAPCASHRQAISTADSGVAKGCCAVFCMAAATCDNSRGRWAGRFIRTVRCPVGRTDVSSPRQPTRLDRQRRDAWGLAPAVALNRAIGVTAGERNQPQRQPNQSSRLVRKPNLTRGGQPCSLTIRSLLSGCRAPEPPC